MFFGADTEQLRGWAGRAVSSATILREDLARTVQDAFGVAWEGADAENFRARLQQLQGELSTTTEHLAGLGTEVQDHADAQDLASEAANSGAPSDRDPAPQGQDQDGDPVGPPGDYVPFMPAEDGWDVETAEHNAELWIDPDMVEQGSVGDCGLMASLMGIAQHDPDLIRDNMVRNEDGTWTVTLYKDGVPVQITVESTLPEGAARSIIPVDRDGDGEAEEYTRSHSWVSIYEKAMAEYTSQYGDSSYAEIDNGGYGDEYMSILTGQESQRTDESDFADIQSRLEEGPVSAATEQPREWWRLTGEVDDPTVVPNHEYNVQQIIPAGTPAADGTVATEDRIHLDNPWGPDGGGEDSAQVGDLYLTEQQYQDNFRAVSSVPTP